MSATDVSAQASDHDVDLLVLGAGTAGMTAALVAAIEGMKVLLVEKTGQVGGTSATSAGTIWIPGNRQSREAGFADTAEAAATYLDALIGQPDHDGKRQAFLDTGPIAVDYLAAKSEVRFLPSGKHPDYRDMPGSAVVGRTLVPAPFDGRLLGPEFERVRPPIPEFMVLGGMMVGKLDIPKLLGRFRSFGNFLYAGKLFTRYLTDRLRYSRGTRLMMGNALVARLFYSLRQRQVPVLFNTQVEELLHEGDRVSGAILRSDGRRLVVRAHAGVVLATGGYGRNAELRKKFMPVPTPVHSIAASSVEGDGIALGISSGAAMDAQSQGSSAFWAPVSLTKRRDGTAGVFPHLVMDRAKPGVIAVNAAGERFVNEGCAYHDFVLAMYASHAAEGCMPAYLICEAAFVTHYGLGVVHPGTTDLAPWEAEGYLRCAPTLEALAAKVNLPATALQATVERHNLFARSGKDLDFGKGETELNRFNGDPAHQPNPCLGEIRQGPFVALAVWPAELGTSAGLDCDADGRVLDQDQQPIPGLYACGNDMGSMMKGTYPGPGTTLGPAIAFAYRVALHALKQAAA